MFFRMILRSTTTSSRRHRQGNRLFLFSHGWMFAIASTTSSSRISNSNIDAAYVTEKLNNKKRRIPFLTNVFFPSNIGTNMDGQKESSKITSTTTRSFSSSSAHERTPMEKVMTDDCLAILKQAIQAVDPYTAVRTYLKMEEDEEEDNSNSVVVKVGPTVTLDLKNFDDIVLISFGKASSAMATAVIQQLTKKEDNSNLPSMQGVVIVKDEHGTKEERKFLESYNIMFREGSHPVPDDRSANAAKEIMDMVSKMGNSRTLVICCISGGGSALFCLPQSPLKLQDIQETNNILLSSGLSIQEINVIRKRLEDGKGGRLAAAAYPSTVLSLVLSDVLGDPLDLIASGPTVPDNSNFSSAWELVKKNGLESKLPKKVVQMLKDGLDGNMSDSPSEDHPIFQEKGKCETIVIGNNELAVESAALEAQRRGYNTRILGSRVEGEAKHAASFYAAMVQHLAKQRKSSTAEVNLFSVAELPTALIAGGETTVSIPSDSNGKGGRNQELVLAAALKFQELQLRDVVLASAGTDGTDGPTDAAGAVIDGGSVARLEGDAEEALHGHDAYNYLDKSEQDGHTPLIKLGPTGTNVADVCVVLVR